MSRKLNVLGWLFVVLTFTGSAGAVPDPAPEPADAYAYSRAASATPGVTDAKREAQLSARLFKALRRLIEGACTHLTRFDDLDLTLLSSEIDARERMYFDLEGELDLRFPILPDRLASWVERLPGERTLTEGSTCLDFIVTVAERTGDNSYHFEFRLNAVFLGEHLPLRMTRALAGLVADVALPGVAEEVLSAAEEVDPAAMGEALATGLRGLSGVLAKVAVGEVEDGVHTTGADRRDLAPPSGASMVMAHLGRAVAKGLVKVGARVAGISVGVAVAAALSMPGGLAAAVGAAGMTLVGRFAFKKVTVDLPMAYRLSRIGRLARERARASEPRRAGELSRKLEKQEQHVLRRVAHEMERDRFSFLDALIGQVVRRPLDQKALYRPLADSIGRLLRFQAVENGDRLFARKLAQLKRAFAEDERPGAPTAIRP